MDIAFTGSPPTRFVKTGWPLRYEREQVRATLSMATARAARSWHMILASCTFPAERCDALLMLRAFRQLELGPVLYWEQPSEERALVGVGVAATVRAGGETRFADATTAWRALQKDAVMSYARRDLVEISSGPILFGGFAFDQLAPSTPLWEGFPDGLLILPNILFHQNEQGASLTVNWFVPPSADVAQLTDECLASLARQQQRVEELLNEPPEVEQPAAAQSEGRLETEDLLPADTWKEIVAQGVREIRDGAYKKIVLARAVQARRPGAPFDIETTLARLRAAYPRAYVFAIQRGARYFVAATPERLVYAQDGRLSTMALAGSAPRGATPEEDRRLGMELLQSAKNQQEHAIVVETIRTALSAFCSKVWLADAPHLLQLKNIQHLETPITGEMLPGRCVLEALGELHPTPAVGGFPRQPALDAIRAHERLDRGWYAGPVGWLDMRGNGVFAVALRSALIDGEQATLFAGNGIVADSDPESEYAETRWKLLVMLHGLGGAD